MALDGTNSLKHVWHPRGSHQFTEAEPKPGQPVQRCLGKSPGYTIVNLTMTHEKKKNPHICHQEKALGNNILDVVSQGSKIKSFA